ncbi:MAG: GNAT family N-acetyltransferase [Planctomycetota bacterium]
MSDLLRGPAYRIETERLVLRCFDPKDAPALKAAVDASIDHIRPWIPWARDEPQTLDQKVETLRNARGQFDLGRDRLYGVFDRSESRLLGGVSLHDRAGEGARELGYWIAKEHARQGFTTEATSALVRTAFEIDLLERVEIHCEPENGPSVAVARKLGFRHDGTLRARFPRRDGPPASCMIWSLLCAEYLEGPCARAICTAFDAIGRRILEAPAPARPRSAFR